MNEEMLEAMEDDIVQLQSADGELIDFVEIAGIALEGNYYVILQPVELFDGMNEDEALAFRVSRGEEGDKFEIVFDEDLIDRIFAAYDRLYEEAHNN